MIRLFDVLNSASEESGDENRRPPRHRRRRIFKPRINFNLAPTDNQSRFRLTNAHVDQVVQELAPIIQHATNRNFALSPEQQIRLSLRYLATGDYYGTVSDAHGCHKSTLSRTLHRFVDAVNAHLFDAHVSWPSEQNQARCVVAKFLEKAGMPSIIGCVDGTHVDVVNVPKALEWQFVNRHGNHSVNAMVVCGPTLRFYYVSSRWPGSVSDQRVLRNSNLHGRLENGWRPAWMANDTVLLGDSGYANTDFLVTPILHPATAQERRYNRSHRRTRRLVECAIGVLKQRFRCLLLPQHLAPAFVGEIVRCCAVLHNMLLGPDKAAMFEEDNNWRPDPFLDSSDDDDDDYDNAIAEEAGGSRQQLVQGF